MRRILGLSLLLCVTASFALAGPVAQAARDGDPEKIESLLAAGEDANEPGGTPPLYFAAQGGHTEAVRILLAAGADPNGLSEWGRPLHIASRRGYQEIVRSLLEHGADPNQSGGENSRVPLHDAAQTNRAEIARILIEAGADVNLRATGQVSGPPLHFALYRGNQEVAAVIRDAGAAAFPTAPITRAEFEAADIDYGKARATQCTPCHTLVPGPMGERGPTLWGIIGRQVAAKSDFPYTQPMAEFGGAWTYERLNQFIRDVRGTIPGTEMNTGDLPDRTDRIALIAYLRLLADDPIPLPAQ